MKGRSVLLKLCQSISFFDNSFKKIANENLHFMTYLEKAAEAREDEEETMEQSN